jgi:DNA-binding transcriptional regulator YdaS (Cro superfamily)
MNLKEYFKTEPHGSKKEMANFLGISQTWMGLLISERRKPSIELAKKIKAASQGLITLHDLRSDLFNANEEIV